MKNIFLFGERVYKKISIAIFMMGLLILSGCSYPASDPTGVLDFSNNISAFFYEAGMVCVKTLPQMFLSYIGEYANSVPLISEDSPYFTAWKAMTGLATGILGIFVIMKLYQLFIRKKEQDFRKLITLTFISLVFIYGTPLINTLFVTVFFGPGQELTAEDALLIPKEGGLIYAFQNISNSAANDKDVFCLDNYLYNPTFVKNLAESGKSPSPLLNMRSDHFDAKGVWKDTPSGTFQCSDTKYSTQSDCEKNGKKWSTQPATNDLWRGCNSVGAKFMVTGNSFETHDSSVGYTKIGNDGYVNIDQIKGFTSLKLSQEKNDHANITIGAKQCIPTDGSEKTSWWDPRSAWSTSTDLKIQDPGICQDIYETFGTCQNGTSTARTACKEANNCGSKRNSPCTWYVGEDGDSSTPPPSELAIRNINTPYHIFYPEITFGNAFSGLITSAILAITFGVYFVVYTLSHALMVLLPLMAVVILFDAQWIGVAITTLLFTYLVRIVLSLVTGALYTIPGMREGLYGLDLSAGLVLAIILILSSVILIFVIRRIILPIGTTLGAELSDVSILDAGSVNSASGERYLNSAMQMTGFGANSSKLRDKIVSDNFEKKGETAPTKKSKGSDLDKTIKNGEKMSAEQMATDPMETSVPKREKTSSMPSVHDTYAQDDVKLNNPIPNLLANDIPGNENQSQGDQSTAQSSNDGVRDMPPSMFGDIKKIDGITVEEKGEMDESKTEGSMSKFFKPVGGALSYALDKTGFVGLAKNKHLSFYEKLAWLPAQAVIGGANLAFSVTGNGLIAAKRGISNHYDRKKEDENFGEATNVVFQKAEDLLKKGFPEKDAVRESVAMFKAEYKKQYNGEITKDALDIISRRVQKKVTEKYDPKLFGSADQAIIAKGENHYANEVKEKMSDLETKTPENPSQQPSAQNSDTTKAPSDVSDGAKTLLADELPAKKSDDIVASPRQKKSEIDALVRQGQQETTETLSQKKEKMVEAKKQEDIVQSQKEDAATKAITESLLSQLAPQPKNDVVTAVREKAEADAWSSLGGNALDTSSFIQPTTPPVTSVKPSVNPGGLKM